MHNMKKVGMQNYGNGYAIMVTDDQTHKSETNKKSITYGTS